MNKRIRLTPSIEDWAIKILKKEAKPLHYKRLTEKIMDERPIGGKTPDRTVYSVLLRSEHIRRTPESGYFTLQAKS